MFKIQSSRLKVQGITLHKSVLTIGCLMVVLCTAPIVNAQYTCGGAITPVSPQSLSCAQQGIDWHDKYRQQSTYIPDTVSNQLEVKKTINIAIHVWYKDDGTGNYPNNASTVDSLSKTMQLLNMDMWTQAELPSDPIPGVAFYRDTRLRVNLTGIYFHDSTAMWSKTCFDGADLTTAAIALDPQVEHSLNIHIIRANCCGTASGAANYPTYNFQTTSSVVTSGMADGGTVIESPYGFAQHLAHEIGHNMALRHPYNTEYCHFSDLDFLSDLFGSVQQPWCITPLSDCDICYHDAGWNLDTDVPSNTATNNMMGGTKDAAYYTPLQLGRIHRSLALMSVRKYAWGYDTIPYNISADETWDFNIKFYQDIVVLPGRTLTIKCIVEMVPQAKIVVKQGGRLIIDGGKITAAQYCDTFWRGIEVWGTSDQNQSPTMHPTYQGIVILKNGAVIEHAREAIQAMNPLNWNTTGGVVQVQGTIDNPVTFKNCRRAASFILYHNFTPATHTTIANASYFHGCHFVVDDNYRGGNDFYAHVSLWNVEGIDFANCTFENAQTTIQLSSHLGQGILSIDANYRVHGGCSCTVQIGQPCPEECITHSSFIGMDHGIDASGSGQGYAFTADNCIFADNVCGVYASGLTNFIVTRNQFAIGGRDVALDSDIDHSFGGIERGIFSYRSSGFRIEENQLVKSDVTYTMSDGIVVGSSGDNNDVVYKNGSSNLDNAYIGEGPCVDPANDATIGLQFLCNTNDNDRQDFWVRLTTDPNISTHGIRTRQGVKTMPAGNTFDQEVSTLDQSDYRNDSYWQIGYWHSFGVQEPMDVTSLWLQKNHSLVTNTCPSNFENGKTPKLSSQQQTQLEQVFVDEKEAYVAVSYLYKSLLDGGNTDALVQQVEQSWPSDAWALRNQLMDKSPYLSTDVLKEMMTKHTMPDVMNLEICTANPDATKKDGFVKWLTNEAPYPLPEYMVDLIMASWDTKTFRTELESNMGRHHAAMSQAGYMLLADMKSDTLSVPEDSVLARWRALPNFGARYGELTNLVQRGLYTDAEDLLNGLGNDYPMVAGRLTERDRTLALINMYRNVQADGRNLMQLNSGEVTTLNTTFARGFYDLPATWAQNLLCFGYGICTTPASALTERHLKAKQINTSEPEQAQAHYFQFHPNPASGYVTFEYKVTSTAQSLIRITDALGRELGRLEVQGEKGQLLWDTRRCPAGVYTVELVIGAIPVKTRQLIIQP